jgi:hypothetical protein
MNLDERLESVAKGMKSINVTLGPLLQAAPTPTVSEQGEPSNSATILRKHVTLVAEWEAVQDESDVLREELKEDKWLTVFRTVTDQADGMMSSLEKAVNRCQVRESCMLVFLYLFILGEQDFIWQIHRRGPDESTSSISLSGSVRSNKSPLNVDVFNSLLESFEAKKKCEKLRNGVLVFLTFGLIDSPDTTCQRLQRFYPSSTKVSRIVSQRTVKLFDGMPNLRNVGEICENE